MSYSQSYYSNGDDHRSIKRRRVSDQSYDTSITSHQFYEPPQEAPAAPSFKAKDGSRMVWDQKAAKWVKEVEVKVEEPANPAPSFTAKDGTRMIWDVKSSKWVKDTKQHTISLAPVSIQPLHRGHEDSRYSNAYHIQDQNGSGASSGPFVIPASNVMYDPTQPADQYPTTGMSYNNPSLDSTSFSIDDLIKGLQQPASSHVPINSAPTPPKPPIIIQPSPIEQIDLPTRRDSQSPETVGASGIEQLFKDVDWSRADRKTLHDVFYHMDGEMFASHYDEDTTMKDEESATSKFPVKSKSNGTTYHPFARRDENVRHGYQLKSEHEAGDPTCRPVKKEGQRYLGLDDMCGMLSRPSKDPWDEFAMATQLQQLLDDNDVNVPPPP